MDWIVRPVVPGDADGWERLRTALWPEDALGHAREIQEFFAGEAVLPHHALIALHPDGTAVGFAELSIRTWAEGCCTHDVAYLEGWFVAAEFRRRGVGAALLRAAEEWGRIQGCHELASDAAPDNELSLEAHLALGFEDVGLIRCFRKELRSSGD